MNNRVLRPIEPPRIVNLPNAKHGFTNPDAHKAHLDGLAYDASADKQSWAAMLKLFKEVLG